MKLQKPSSVRTSTWDELYRNRTCRLGTPFAHILVTMRPVAITAILITGALCILLGVRAQGPARAENGYTDPALCSTCHAGIAETYSHTGMGRSFYRPNASNQIEDYGKGNPYYHKASDTWYRMEVRGGEYFQTQYQIGPGGQQINIVEKQIHYVVGSGNHSRTYLNRTPRNTLAELPLAWYAENGGYWAMNPGYDKSGHEGFQRRIQYDCMFCHNGYPNPQPSGSAQRSADAIFPAALPEGIDCQRCHGPGRAHVEAAQKRGTIINPAKLSRERQAEVCLQCHLETTSFPLPGSLLREGREPFSYRPGEPLAEFKLFFDHPPGKVREEKFEIASAAYQMDQSKCVFRRGEHAGEKLTCTTCHNPHDVSHGTAAATQYNAVCKDCHATLRQHVADGNCIDCHMPKRRPDDAVHVVMTDHRIQRIKPARDLTTAIAETHDGDLARYRGEVVPYGPQTGRVEDELYRAIAQVVQNANLETGIPRLEAAIRKYNPVGPGPYLQLGDALRNQGRCDRAVPVYEEALRRGPGSVPVTQKLVLCLSQLHQDARAIALLKPLLERVPDDAKAWTQLGLALIASGKAPDGIAALVKATVLDPDLPEAWNDLGGIWLQAGDFVRAEPALRNAVRAQPNYPVARNNLANLLAATKRYDEAWYQFEAALRYNPDYLFARHSYGLALGAAGRLSEARAQLETVLKADPAAAESHEALGRVAFAQGSSTEAVIHYREAVRLRPDFARGNLSLGAFLADSGQTDEALIYLRKAAQSTDPAIRNGAEGLIKRYRAK